MEEISLTVLALEQHITKLGITRLFTQIGITGPSVSLGERPAPIHQKVMNDPNAVLSKKTPQRQLQKAALET